MIIYLVTLLGLLLLNGSTDVGYKQRRIAIIPIALPLPLPVLASRSSIDSSFILQVGHNAVLFQIINIQSLEEFF